MISKAQKRALASLVMLMAEDPDEEFHSRLAIGGKARHDCNSYPLSTMLTLKEAGYVEPENEAAVWLVYHKTCSCGCDRWRATEKGIAFFQTLDIRFVGEGNGQEER